MNQILQGRVSAKLSDPTLRRAEQPNIRMHQRRMTRLTNAFSKSFRTTRTRWRCTLLYYNFVRVHKTLRTPPAMAAGVTKRLWEMTDVVDVLEAWEARDRVLEPQSGGFVVSGR